MLGINKGFTLIELIITLAVISIIISVAVPSFGTVIKNNRLSTQANELITSINYARSEAIRRGAQVTLNSGSVNWHEGWTVDDSGGETIRNYSAFEGVSTLVCSTGALAYLGSGYLSGADEITFDLCDDRTNSTGRRITVSVTGRVSIGDLDCNPA